MCLEFWTLTIGAYCVLYFEIWDLPPKAAYTAKLSPHPQVLLALGFIN